MALPNWIAPVEGRPNCFEVDPDVFYPSILEELGVEKPTEYWLEVALGVMKLDFDIATKMEKAVKANVGVERRIRGDNGRKARWNFASVPKGTLFKADDLPVAKKEEGKECKSWSEMGVSDRARHIRYHYKRIRGFMPSG